MKKDSVTRDDFKWNFLKTIILRMDFQGVLDNEIEKSLQKIKPFLRSNDFDRCVDREDNQVDLNLDSKSIEDGSIPVRELRKVKVYSYINEKEGYVFDISKKHICLKITASNYIKFEDYSKLFVEVLNLLSEGIDFFTPTRLGLRKINFCLMNSLDDVSRYFDNNYFNYHNPFSDAKIVLTENRRHIQFDSKKMNIVASIQQGRMKKDENKEHEVYKVILDTDIYVDEENVIRNLIMDNNQLTELNELVFKVYVDSISEKMVDALCTEDFSIDMTGVNRNDY